MEVSSVKWCELGYSFRLWQIRGIEHLADPLFTFAFPEHQSNCSGMGKNMASCWFFGI